MNNLIDIYIQEVSRRLPEKNRDDIALELRSTIEDMLPNDYSEEDIKKVLKELGSPVTMASGYRERPMYLIGPRYFDVYATLLKMILPIAIVISLISMIAEYFIGLGEEQAVINIVMIIMGEGILRMIEVGIQAFFWLTVVFAILERKDKGKDEQPLTASLKKWTPDDLKNIPYIHKKKEISKFEVFLSLMGIAILATFYFYANHLAGVYEGGNYLKLVIPTFNQDVLLRYWPIVVIMIILGIAFSLYKLMVGQWTKKMAMYNSVLQLIGTIVFIIIIKDPNLLSKDFIMYMTDLFSITTFQFKTWIVGGGIIFFIIVTAINVIDGFRKASSR